MSFYSDYAAPIVRHEVTMKNRYFCTGETADGKFTMVVCVSAKNEKEARSVIKKHYPDMKKRFCCANMPLDKIDQSSRFP